MSKARLIKRMYCEVNSLDPLLLPATAFQAVIDSIKPFINIYFSARLITLLTQKADVKTIVSNIVLVLGLNVIIFFLASFLNNYNETHRMMLLDLENKKVEEKLYNADYALLNDSEFKELLHRHEEAGKSRWARLPYYMWTTLQFTRGVLTTIISFIIIIPLLKVGFVKTGDTFFERPLFIITIVASIAIMAVVILIVASNINKSYLEANEKYAELDRIFYFFIDILGDYKTGKEIRLYIENAGSFPKPLSAKEEKKALEQMASGDTEAKNRLIEHNLRLVAHIIKKYYSNYSDQEDLISIGTIGLIKGINSFDYTKGTRLATYASRCIENEILMHFRSQKKSAQDISMSEPIDTDSEGNPLTLSDIVYTDDTIADDLDKKIKIEKLREYIDEMDDSRDREIILKRYGLFMSKPMTQREIAEEMGISRSYVSRIEKRALKKLREKFTE